MQYLNNDGSIKITYYTDNIDSKDYTDISIEDELGNNVSVDIKDLISFINKAYNLEVKKRR